MPRQPEGKLVKKMKEKIIEHGGRPFKIHGSDEGLQEVGIPDLLWVYRGRFIGSEAKQPGEKLRPTQRMVLCEIFDAGGVASVIETVGQLAVLLTYLEKESELGTPYPAVCFDRGSIRYDHCQFS